MGCFSSLKARYRALIAERFSLIKLTKVNKLQMISAYAVAREAGLLESNIQLGWRATDLMPVNRHKVLNNPHVVV